MAKFKRVTALMLPGEAQDAFMHAMTEELDTPISQVIAKVNAALKKDI